jgi:hypothetical protein
MSPLPNRIVVYAKDIMNITGRRERAARKLLASIRRRYKKRRGTFVSIEEFCTYTGLKAEHVSAFLI